MNWPGRPPLMSASELALRMRKAVDDGRPPGFVVTRAILGSSISLQSFPDWTGHKTDEHVLTELAALMQTPQPQRTPSQQAVVARVLAESTATISVRATALVVRAGRWARSRTAPQ